MKTQVAIVGAGPAGLMLGHLLHNAGIDTVIVENRSRKYIEERVRAGVLEQGTVTAMIDSGVGDRLQKEGLQHDYIDLRFNCEQHRLNIKELSRGRSVWVYAQHEIVKDLVAARLGYDDPLYFEASDVSIHDVDTDKPSIRFIHQDKEEQIDCDFVAGCDGFHGISRGMIPESELTILRSAISVCLARRPRRNTTGLTRSYLRLPRTRVCAAKHARPEYQQAVCAMPGRRHRGGLVG